MGFNSGFKGLMYARHRKEHPASSFNKGKGKVIPLQAWTGPVGSRKLRLPDFTTIGT